MSLRLVARALAPILAAALLGAGGALAAQVSTSSHCETHGGGKGCAFIATATYTAAPGEANELQVTREAGAFVFSDVVPVDPGAGCEARSPTAVACPARWGVANLGDEADTATARYPFEPTNDQFYVRLRVDGEAGPDRISVPLIDTSARGGDGDDELSGGSLFGGAGSDTLTGTHSRDYLDAGPGEDEIHAGAGDDLLLGDNAPAPEAVEPKRDLLDGGDGSDTASYGAHDVPVEVRLADGTGGADGEDDRLIGVESAVGGGAGDRLIGDEGPNRLQGGTGNDREGDDHDVLIGHGGDDDLSGEDGNDFVDGGPGADMVRGGSFHDMLVAGPGDDVLEGGHGTDRFSAGDGDDLIYVADIDAGTEPLACGPGRDRALVPFVALLDPDCELVVVGANADEGPRIPAYPSAGGRARLVFKFGCPLPRACTGRLRLRLAGQPRQYFADRRWTTRNGRVRLVVTVPRRVRDRPEVLLPVVARVNMKHGRKPEYDRHGGVWSFDLRSVPGFAR